MAISVPGRYAHNTIGMMSLIKGFLVSWEVSGWMVSSPNYSNENFIIELRRVWKWELPSLWWLWHDLVWAAKRVASVSLDRETGPVWTADEERPCVALEITWEHSVSEMEEKPKKIQWNAVRCVALEHGHSLWVEYVNLGSEWDSGCAVNDYEIQSCPRLPSSWAVMEGMNLQTLSFSLSKMEEIRAVGCWALNGELHNHIFVPKYCNTSHLSCRIQDQ